MISRILLLIGIFCMGLYGFFSVQAYFHQETLEDELYQPLQSKVAIAGPARGKHLKEFLRLSILSYY